MKPSAIAAVVVVAAAIRVPRLHTTAAHGTLGKRLVMVGVVLSVVGFVALVGPIVTG